MKNILTGILMVFFLIGCGSGGGGSDNTAPQVSSTVPANTAGGVAINTKIAASFSEAMDPLTITTTTFTVSEGTTPVSGTVTGAGVAATFMPMDELTYNTIYTATITTGAKDREGNSLKNVYQWRFETGETPDALVPEVTSTGSPNGAEGLPINRVSTAIFSEMMNPLTITPATFTVTGPGTTPVTGTVNYVGVTATFRPKNNFIPNTLYTSTITVGAEDLAGNPMENDYIWSWTTGEAPDMTSPKVSATVPANLMTGVSINKKIAATFSEVMNPLTISNATFTVTGPGATLVTGTVSCVGVTATFIPGGNLEYHTTYTATMANSAEDLAGNALKNKYVWSFTTGNAPDTTPPTVSSTGAPDGATDLPVNRAASAIFSEEMDPLTITTGTFRVTGPGEAPVPGTVIYAGVTAIFTPAQNLSYDTAYTSRITTGVRDLAGNSMESDYVLSWETGDDPDISAPSVISTDPADFATDVAINKNITVIFSEAMDPTRITTETFMVSGPGITSIFGTVTYVGVTATLMPFDNLEYNTTYTATVYNGALDLACNPLESDYVWSFTTGFAPDDTPSSE